MASKAVIGFVSNVAQANQVVDDLQTHGISPRDVSVIFPDETSTRDFAIEKNTKAPEGAVAGGSAGGVLGGTLGLLVGAGTLAIPGLGPVVAAGPLVAALSGAAAGGALGGVAGALVGAGIPELEAKQYAERLSSGAILLSVHAEDAEQQRIAQSALELNGSKEVAKVSEASG